MSVNWKARLPVPKKVPPKRVRPPAPPIKPQVTRPAVPGEAAEYALTFAHGRPRFGTKRCCRAGCSYTATAELTKKYGDTIDTAYFCHQHAKKIEEEWKDREEHGY